MYATRLEFDSFSFSSIADTKLYQLSEPVKCTIKTYHGELLFKDSETKFVLVSAVDAVDGMGGKETFIFPSDYEGNTLSMLELPGSFTGGMDHERALKGLGVDVITDETST